MLTPNPPPSEAQQRVTPKRAGTALIVAAIVAAIFRVEGGYVNDPKDLGGETNYGITKQVARQHGYNGPMLHLPKDKAGKIYVSTYIQQPGFMPMIDVEPAVAEELVDTAVNMGPARPSRWFQQSLNEICGAGVVVDAKVGAGTIAAYAACQRKVPPAMLCTRMLDALDTRQSDEYRRLVARNSSLSRFLKGWLANRIGNVDRAKCRKDA